MAKKTEKTPRAKNLQIIRLPPVLMERLDKLADKMEADPKMQGAKVTRTDIMRQTMDIGIDELERRWS
jgi:predicted transcriptional regulator